jgi:hypothetical protein
MKQNLRKKALVPAIAMVVASVIALSGVTYAWFTTGNTASVTGLDVNVQAANGIQISLDAASWRSVLTADDLIEGTTKSNVAIQFPTNEIAPVSTAANIVDGKMEMFLGAYATNGTLTSVKEVETTSTTGNFVAFDLYFKSSMAQTLSLDMGDNLSFVKCVDLVNGGASNVGTEKAVRVAFLDMGSAAAPAAARALKTPESIKIWEPNATTRADGVEAEAGKLPYDGFKAEFSNVAESALGEEQVAAVTTLTEASDFKFELEGAINKIRVYIWLEGQDVDCINNISFGDFTTNLAFSVPEVE